MATVTVIPKYEGIVPLGSVAENIALAKHNVGAHSVLLGAGPERGMAVDMIKRMRIKAALPVRGGILLLVAVISTDCGRRKGLSCKSGVASLRPIGH